MPEQLAFELPLRAARGREDFFVSEANALALAQIDTWRDWAGGKLVLVGPKGSGKTHLAHVWAADSGAEIITARNLVGADIMGLCRAGAVVVEDIEKIAGTRPAEEALFHLHNLLLAEGGRLLVTARNAPNTWAITLPDLASRMQGTVTATLSPPDDSLLAALLVKLFNDRQLTVDLSLITYLLGRMERSFAAAQALVSELDHRALATGRKPGRRLAAEILDNSV